MANSAPSVIDLLAAGVFSIDEGEEDEVELDDDDNDDQLNRVLMAFCFQLASIVRLPSTVCQSVIAIHLLTL